MIALDTSAIVAIALAEPEAESFKTVLRENALLIGWPTLFETRIVLAAKGFSNAGAIVAQLAATPNVTALPFDAKHFSAAEAAYERFGRGRHPAGLNMGDCFAYAVAAVAKAPLLFKGLDFGQTDILRHPASSRCDQA
ncbi:ribonuclease VapC [Rhodoblastus acidophilus]|uniref:type II toxin-antitoxin system VapC family toxin n=1 Tax=Rhodoblastus acidophilus TaxID=1074 RepID=UPI002225894A|nr:type II toxin-antitoxin system VapC family toxin [Rhodoblastus acidophilus]MCW2286294.1 ribonuclease VapC [Rhodoblastus acidophilus]MCW2335189.1 ribonuclease VapC [Rhodoblastus acidophilus]